MTFRHFYLLILPLLCATIARGQHKGQRPHDMNAVEGCVEQGIYKAEHELKELLDEAEQRGISVRLSVASNFFQVYTWLVKGDRTDEVLVNFDCYPASDTVRAKENCTGVLWHSGLPVIQKR